MKIDPLVAYQYDVLIRSYYKGVKFKPFIKRTKNITAQTLFNSPLRRHYQRLAATANSEEQLRLWLSIAYFIPDIKSIPQVMSNLADIEKIAMLTEAPEYHINKDLRKMDKEGGYPLFYALTNGLINPITFCLCVGWLGLVADKRDFFRNGVIQRAKRFLIINEFAMVSGANFFITKNEIWGILRARFKEEPKNYLEFTAEVEEAVDAKMR